MSLPSGSHTLTVSVLDQEGRQFYRTLSFTIKKSSSLEEAYSKNEVSVLYEAALVKPDSAANVPYSKVEGNLKSDSKIKNKGWEFGFSTNLRYFDQNLPVQSTGTSSSSGQSPITKGISLMNYLLTGKYSKDDFRASLEIGDVLISETQNTVSGLGRRGGKISLQYKDYSLNTFVVNAESVTGFRGGFGIDGTSDDHILGISGGAKFFDKKAEFKTVYVTGGDPGNSVGVSTTSGTMKGDVVGFLLTTDFFANRMRTEMEADFSRFDPDTSDEFDKKSSQAYRLKAGGTINKYSYEALYEYFGRDYAVIGNQGARKDTEGASLMNTLALDNHTLSLLLSRYNDNVKGDGLFPRIYTSQGNLSYSYNGIQSLPMNVSYQKMVQESEDEPAATEPMDKHLDTMTGAIVYLTGNLSLAFTTSCSFLNDRTAVNADTTTINYTFMPTYFTGAFSVSPAFSLNRSKDHLSAVWTDTYTASMNMGTKFLRDKASFDAGGTYTDSKTDSGTMHTKDLNLNARVGYSLKELIKGWIDPTIALRSAYHKITDRVNPDADRDEFTLFLVLSVNMPFSL
jgi:hypothetical protein